MKPFAVCFSGHRHLDFADERLRGVVESMLLCEIRAAIADGANRFYTGMAVGVDLMAADLVLEEQKLHPTLELTAVLPYPKQPPRIATPQSEAYERILAAANEVICVCPQYRKDCFRIRNQYMIDHSERLIAVLRDLRSGTGQTVHMAKHRGILARIIDINQVETLLCGDNAERSPQAIERNFTL